MLWSGMLETTRCPQTGMHNVDDPMLVVMAVAILAAYPAGRCGRSESTSVEHCFGT